MLKRPLCAVAIPGALTAALLVGSVVASPAGAVTQVPSALVSASLAAAGKQSSVHFVAVSSLGAQSITIVADAATKAGQQVITIKRAKQTGVVNSRFAGKDVYYRGNTIGLEAYLGMPSTLAPHYAGKWISFSPSDPDYAQIAKSMTIASAVSEISLTAPLKVTGAASIHGVRTIGVSGVTTSLSSSGTKGTATLYMSASKAPLPILFTGKGSQKGQTELGKVTFSRWGAPVNPATPKNAIPASSISGGSSSSTGSSTTPTTTPTSTSTSG
jgi:hypothetical protein